VSKAVSRGTGPKFDLLGPGHLNPDMREHGGRPELAPYPNWTARYLAHKNLAQKRYVLAHGDLGGSWPVHLREAEKGKFKGLGPGRLVSIDERPDFWLDNGGRGDPRHKPAGDMNAQGTLVPDNAHVPSLAYVPYLITGDRYYCDEMRFWANYGLLRTFQDSFYNARGGSKGLLETNETRGFAWVLRNLADAAAYLPDADPAKAYLAQKVTNNLKWADAYADRHRPPLGTVFEKASGPSIGEQPGIATSENNFLGWSLDHAERQGFSGGGKLRDRIAKFQLSLYTSKDFPRRYAAVSHLRVGTLVGSRKEQRIEYYRTLKRLREENFKDGPKGLPPFAGYYGVNQRLMLLIAQRHKWPGAAEAYKYLHSQIEADLAERSGWALAAEHPPGTPRR
jgi:hypothetical protein